MPIEVPPHLIVLYKNYKGEYSIRRVIPTGNWHGTSEHHPEVKEQSWFMEVIDLDKRSARTFHMPDILAIGKDNIFIFLDCYPSITEVLKNAAVLAQ